LPYRDAALAHRRRLNELAANTRRPSAHAGHVAIHERIDNGFMDRRLQDQILVQEFAGIVPRIRQRGTAELRDGDKTRPGVVRIGVKRILG
jgi:hypothetical protein